MKSSEKSVFFASLFQKGVGTEGVQISGRGGGGGY
jgi:hypothetical protein